MSDKTTYYLIMISYIILSIIGLILGYFANPDSVHVAYAKVILYSILIASILGIIYIYFFFEDVKIN